MVSVELMKIFKNAWFRRFAKREKISDAMLRKAIARVDRGIIDANLGGHIIKQRIARAGQGKSSGYRTIIIFRKEDKAFLFTGLPKIIKIISARMNYEHINVRQKNY